MAVEMSSQAQVVVIGGGVVGCSVLYHLTELGWTDVMLIERSVLTSGSTWHAAGGMHTLNSDPNVAKLQEYTINLYETLEKKSGQSCGIHMTGGVLLAGTEERMDWLKRTHSAGKYLGIETEIISVDEAARLFPLMDPQYFVGAVYEPVVGHIDPSGVTHAYAKAARNQGAKTVENNRVTGMEQNSDGSWNVITEKGTVRAEHVVNAGGLWARECGRMVGLELPILAMEHHYILTDDMPEVIASEEEVIHAVDFEGEIYMRQERQGMLMGTYEKACVPWSEKETPWDFGHELLQPDIDRISPSLEVGFKHFPAFERAGIREMINGPFTFAPDGNPVIGPVRGMTNYWSACGVMAGFSQGGGVGMALANWMVHGDPGVDVWAMDIARFGDYADLAYTNAKVRENYSRRFQITFPNEELPAARPKITSPVYESQKARNAVFGAAFGLEYALWYAPEGVAPVEEPTFKRSNSHSPVGDECNAVRNGVGLIETTSFAKYDITGPGAEDWLSMVLANRVPVNGRLNLTPMLNRRGTLIGDFSCARLSNEHFMIFGSGVAEEFHLRWWESLLPTKGVEIRSRRGELMGLSIAGPSSRELLSRLTEIDVGAEAFRFRDFRKVRVADVDAIIGRVTFTGELGYEIWMDKADQKKLFDTLLSTGEDLGIRLFGSRALNSMRLEKSFGSFTREYTPDYTPKQSGFDFFVNYDKGEFIGREAALKDRDSTAQQVLTTLVIDDTQIDCTSDEPVWSGDRCIGYVTSGGYGHHSGKSIALGYVEAEFADGTNPLSVSIIGNDYKASVATTPVYDPKGTKMRS